MLSLGSISQMVGGGGGTYSLLSKGICYMQVTSAG